jgi:hypothetical protein
MTPDEKTPKRRPDWAKIILTPLLSSPIVGLFAAGYVMENTTPSGVPGAAAIFDWASLTGPGIAAAVIALLEMRFGLLKKFFSYDPAAQEQRRAIAQQMANEAWEASRNPSRREVKANEKELLRLRAEGWKELHARHDALILAWSKYETDIALMIDYPIMTDYTDPVIHKVIVAMQKIRTAKMKLEEDAGIDAHDSSLNEAVNEFEVSFQAAERYARRYGQTRLDPREQRKLSMARSALNIILDGEAPAFEVEAAYKSLRSSLKGIIDVPDKALVEIEALVRREIVAS